MTTHYDVLNVSSTSEAVVIRAAYRALMAKYHPDTFTGSRAEADRRSKQINEAYAVLSDPGRRAAYDAELAKRRSAEERGPASGQRNDSARTQPPPPAHVAAIIEEAEPGSGWRHPWLIGALPAAAAILFFVATTDARTAASNEINQQWDSVSTAATDGSELDPALTDMTAATTSQLNDGSPGGRDLLSTEGAPGPEVSLTPITPAEAERLGLTTEDGPWSVESTGAGARDSNARNTSPDFSGVGREDVSTIRIACAADRGAGPVIYNQCVRRHLRDLTAGTEFPDLAPVSDDDASSIRIACASERGDGPRAYNACLRRHLESLGVK